MRAEHVPECHGACWMCVGSEADDRFIQGNFGFACRPWNSSRWGLFGRYTYLYGLGTSANFDMRGSRA